MSLVFYIVILGHHNIGTGIKTCARTVRLVFGAGGSCNLLSQIRNGGPRVIDTQNGCPV